MIDVVNEPLHAPPPYAAALGGAGVTGWDWVINAYLLARQYFPNAQLVINDYFTLALPSLTQQYLSIINLLTNRGLLDGIGEQGALLREVARPRDAADEPQHPRRDRPASLHLGARPEPRGDSTRSREAIEAPDIGHVLGFAPGRDATPERVELFAKEPEPLTLVSYVGRIGPIRFHRRRHGSGAAWHASRRDTRHELVTVRLFPSQPATAPEGTHVNGLFAMLESPMYSKCAQSSIRLRPSVVALPPA